jgi:peptidyl-prolyl cis-trans isomerase A (cyclophilin A)
MALRRHRGAKNPLEHFKERKVMHRLATAIVLISAFTILIAASRVVGEDKSKISDLAYVKMSTTMGDIYIELDRKHAPITAENFLGYVDSKHFDGTIFHRVISGFVIQGGGFTKEMQQKPVRPGIKNEWRNGLKNQRGTLSMARVGGQPESGTSQFFVNLVDNHSLDAPQQDGAAYAVFGKVIKGMDVVDKIKDVKTGMKNGMGDVPVEAIVVNAATRIEPTDPAIKDEAAKSRMELEYFDKKLEAEKKKATEEAMKLIKTRGGDPTKGSSTPSGLWQVDVTPGTGATPQQTGTVTLHCTGWLADGTKFYSSLDKQGDRPVQPLTNALRGFVPGFTEGVSTMKVGGKRLLVIPGNLGYGPSGNPQAKIPPNATLVFEVELLGTN